MRLALYRNVYVNSYLLKQLHYGVRSQGFVNNSIGSINSITWKSRATIKKYWEAAVTILYLWSYIYESKSISYRYTDVLYLLLIRPERGTVTPFSHFLVLLGVVSLYLGFNPSDTLLHRQLPLFTFDSSQWILTVCSVFLGSFLIRIRINASPARASFAMFLWRRSLLPVAFNLLSLLSSLFFLFIAFYYDLLVHFSSFSHFFPLSQCKARSSLALGHFNTPPAVLYAAAFSLFNTLFLCWRLSSLSTRRTIIPVIPLSVRRTVHTDLFNVSSWVTQSKENSYSHVNVATQGTFTWGLI